MRQVVKQGGISFALLSFTFWGEVYFVEAKDLFAFLDNKDQNLKSIPKNDIEERGTLIPLGFHPRIDYLKIIDKIITGN